MLCKTSSAAGSAAGSNVDVTRSYITQKETKNKTVHLFLDSAQSATLFCWYLGATFQKKISIFL